MPTPPNISIASIRGGKNVSDTRGVRMGTREELAWAAGLFEGEGSFTSATRGKYFSLAAELGMTDEDRVREFHRIIGVGNVTTHPRPKFKNWKTVHIWKTASFEGVQATIAMLWPWLGPRRRGRAKGILQSYLPRTNKFRLTHSTPQERMQIRKMLKLGLTVHEIARQTKRSRPFISSLRTHDYCNAA